MASTKESASDALSDREQDKQRIKRLRVALREHSAAIDRVRSAVDAQQLQEFLDRNDELSNQVDDVLAHGLLTDAYLKITLMERELVAKVKTGLSVLDTSAFLERLTANWTVLRDERASTTGGETSLQALRGAGADESSAGAANPQTNQDGRRVVDLDALGRRFYRFFRSAPAPEFMTGPLDLSGEAQSTTCGGAQAPSESRSRPARETNLGTTAEHAEQVPLSDVQEQVRTDVEVKRMFDCMREHGPVELYDLVLDSTSFGRTVENIFHLSFLIRDGRVQLWRDDDRFMIKPLGRRGPEAGRPDLENAGAAENTVQSLGAQTVLRFDRQDWTALCQQRGEHPPLLQRCSRESGGNQVAET
ncbi:hypothetical protein CCYA_CCYA03G1005 [Cyanidiococcus yangmingshanensis]|nr:hypothetical protein CCYA_CCYA03G1005 [Cyanidiococcus yangmingshanensis]